MLEAIKLVGAIRWTDDHGICDLGPLGTRTTAGAGDREEIGRKSLQVHSHQKSRPR